MSPISSPQEKSRKLVKRLFFLFGLLFNNNLAATPGPILM